MKAKTIIFLAMAAERAAAFAFCAGASAACADAVRTLSLDDYRDKMKAA